MPKAEEDLEPGSDPTRDLLARRLVESVGAISRLDQRSHAEEEFLLECAGEPGLKASLPDTMPDFIGSEHEVWSDGVTVTKATFPGTFGRLWGRRRFATPSEYLERIRLTQSAFAFPWRVAGLLVEAGRVRVVTEQPFIMGSPPNHAEIDGFLLSLEFAFRRHRYGDYWIREADGILAFDTEPGNFVKTASGLLPVDLILQSFRGFDPE